MWLSYFRVLSSCAALSGALLSGTYYFVKLTDECGSTALPKCVSERIAPSPATQLGRQEKSTIKPGGQVKRARPPEQRSAIWPQTPASEEMLIWSGHLDGEVGRIALADFERAAKGFQASLAPGTPSDEQRAALQRRVSSIRSGWRFEKESDPSAADLWLPRKLLPSRQDLSHGSRYQSLTKDFAVDVAEWDAAGLTLDKVRQLHCCVISPTRKLEGPVVNTSEASGPGFVLNARDGKQRVSVRAQQRDGVIRILAIAYDMDKDKEYRVLRNAIASSYVAFAAAQKPDERVTSCSKSDNERCAEKAQSNSSPWGRQGPL